MPSYKPSLGTITIFTPFPSFGEWMIEELENFRRWNPELIERRGNTFGFVGDVQWAIRVQRNKIICVSNQPVVYLRHGVRILMGSGKLEIS